ncbi:MAG: PDZ domain-containing protein [bacterium]|nr:PDZ domain-containing protein [bacterium]
MSGLIVSAEGAELDVLRVTHLLENSPAAEAGILAGDIITGVKPHPASALGLNGLNSLFLQDGKTFELSLTRNGAPVNARLTTRRAV